MQNITVTQNTNNTVTVINTVTGQQVVLAASLYAALAATAAAPVPLAALANSYAATLGAKGSPAYAQGAKALRVAVQALAQPGQYHGSPCIGALASTTIPGTSRAQIQWGAGAQYRKPLTRNGGNGGNGTTGSLPAAG